MLQAAAEHEMVWRFTDAANEIGLAIPDHKTVVSGKDQQENWAADGFSFESPASFFGDEHRMIGLAQHHGVPTRFLDWTKRPEVAAFFACEEFVRVPRRMRPGGRFAIWMLSIDPVTRTNQPLKVFTCPRSENNYLHAQDGLFLWRPNADEDFLRTGVWGSFEGVVQQAHPGHPAEPWLIKLTLPHSESKSLLSLLHLEGVSRASLMPGYSSVAHTLKLEWERGLQP